jgi:hypothetical protein
MKFYIGAKAFMIPDRECAVDTKVLGDDRFKEEIEITNVDMRYYESLSDEALKSTIERQVDRALFRIGSQIGAIIEGEVKRRLV